MRRGKPPAAYRPEAHDRIGFGFDRVPVERPAFCFDLRKVNVSHAALRQPVPVHIAATDRVDFLTDKPFGLLAGCRPQRPLAGAAEGEFVADRHLRCRFRPGEPPAVVKGWLRIARAGDGKALGPAADAHFHRPAGGGLASRRMGDGMGEEDVAQGLERGEVAFLDDAAGVGLAVKFVSGDQRGLHFGE